MYSDSIDRGYKSYRTGISSSRSNNGSNPFDISQFNEVRPTYVGPPVEDIIAANTRLTKVSKENRISRTMLDRAFSASINNMQGDDEGVNMILDHKRAFEESMDNIANTSNMAYAGPAIQEQVSKFAKDYRIIGRQGLVDKFNASKEAIRTNANLDTDVKEAWLDGMNDLNKYAKRNDEKGIYDFNEPLLPFEAVDINAELLKGIALRLKEPNITSASIVRFRAPNGDLTDTYNANSTFEIVDSNNTVITSVKPELLKNIMRGIINNNGKLRGYLLQSGVVNEYFNNNKVNVIDKLSAVLADPNALKSAIDNAINDLAKGYEVNGKVTKNDIKSIRLNSGISADTPSTSHGNGLVYGPASSNNETITPDLNSVKRVINSTSTSTQDMFARDNKDEITDSNGKPVYPAFESAVINKQYSDIEDLGSRLHLLPAQLEEYVSSIQENYTAKQLAEAKLNAAKYTALHPYNNSATPYPTLDAISKLQSGDLSNNFIAKRLAELKSLGYDYNDYEGTAVESKIKNMYNSLNTTITAATRGGIAGNTFVPKQSGLSIKPLQLLDFVPKLEQERAKYDKAVNKIIETPLSNSDELATLGVVGFNAKTDTQDFENLSNALSSIGFLQALDVKDMEGNEYSKGYFSKYKAANVKTISYSSKPSGTVMAPSWIINYDLVDNKGDIEHKTFRIPMDANKNGIQQEYFSKYIKNNPKYIANNLVKQVELSNIDSKYIPTMMPLHDKFAISNDIDSQHRIYYMIQGDGRADTGTRAEFVNALANDISTEKVRRLLLDETGDKLTTLYNSLQNIDLSNEESIKQVVRDIYPSIFGTDTLTESNIKRLYLAINALKDVR